MEQVNDSVAQELRMTEPSELADIVYAVDPGKARSSIAEFHDGVFIGCWMTHVSELTGTDRPGRVVMELPMVYPGSRVRANDLVDLTAAGMAVASRLSKPGEKIHTISPADWKGNCPKEVTRKRVLGKLTAEERATLEIDINRVKPGLRHNLFDSIGLALVFLKRARRGVI